MAPRRRTRRTLLGACAALLGIGTLAAPAASDGAPKTLRVPGGYAGIQQAIDAAAAHDTVRVAPGTYRGPFRIQKPVVLVATGGAERTVLEGRDSVRVLSVEGVKGGAILGFWIRGGRATGGGGVHCVRDTSFSIGNCIFSDNWESAVGVWQSSEISIVDCKVRNNKGSGVRFDASNGVVLGGEFSGNEGHEGGGLYLRGSRLLVPLRRTTFTGNRAVGSTGGAIHAADSSEATIAECTFRENTTTVAGGAVAAMTGSRLNVSRCLFARNEAGSGAAVHADFSGLNVGYSTFDRNTSKGAGGAIQITGRWLANVNPILANNTFHKNDVEGEGATLFFVDVSPEVRKNIFVVSKDQRAVTGLRTAPLYDCNLVWDPSGGAIGALPSANTLVGDPLFCDPEREDFALRDLSPAMRAACGPVGAHVAKAGCATFRLQPAR